ncbi:condensation domain-containing protein [Longispora sp. NPDC051575]|uniref:condensation domain-containing protein n=1 Tax=Longispora sp. NPDC051575 TaxID=3154943 RepID=UPI00341EC0F0
MTEVVTHDAPEVFVAPASYAQERVWFASQLARDVPLYHVAGEVTLPYAVSYEQLGDALRVVCERHETMRTSFRIDDGVLMQVVHPDIVLPVELLDLSALPDAETDARIAALLAGMDGADLSLVDPPLWHGTLARRGAADWVLLIVAHHTLFDLEAVRNLESELVELCAAVVEGRAAVLPELPIQYADHAVWQRDGMEAGRLAELNAFWSRELDGLPAVHTLPAGRVRPAERTYAGSEILFDFPDDIVEGVPTVAQRCGATPFMVMLAGYAAMVHQLSRATDVVVGVLVAGREVPETRALIGMFVNLAVSRIDVSGDPTFAELVARVRDRQLGVWDHQDMPFQKLVELVGTHRLPGVPPVYQLGFNYVDFGFSGRATAAEDDLLLEISGSRGRLEYSTDVFTGSDAEAMVDGYLRVLSAVLADPAARLSTVDGGAAPAPAAEGVAAVEVEAAFVAPRTAAEELVAEVWSEVLGVSRIGALDNFFTLGGHSLLALRVIARISAAIEIDLPIQAFFVDTTVAGVAAQVEKMLLQELDDTENASEGTP